MSSCSLAIIGDGATGKSTIVNSFRTDGFISIYKQTIGFDVYEKTISLKGSSYILTCWDIGGQSLNSKNLDKYLAPATAIFLVYDVTNSESFNNLNDWVRLAKQFSKAKKYYLIGNKIDLPHLRQVSDTQHKQFIVENSLNGGFEVSGKTGDNVVKAFYKIAAESLGIQLTSAELAAYDKVLTAFVQISNNDTETRTAFADEIEAEDRAAEERKKQSAASCQCVCS